MWLVLLTEMQTRQVMKIIKLMKNKKLRLAPVRLPRKEMSTLHPRRRETPKSCLTQMMKTKSWTLRRARAKLWPRRLPILKMPRKFRRKS